MTPELLRAVGYVTGNALFTLIFSVALYGYIYQWDPLEPQMRDVIRLPAIMAIALLLGWALRELGVALLAILPRS